MQGATVSFLKNGKQVYGIVQAVFENCYQGYLVDPIVLEAEKMSISVDTNIIIDYSDGAREGDLIKINKKDIRKDSIADARFYNILPSDRQLQFAIQSEVADCGYQVFDYSIGQTIFLPSDAPGLKIQPREPQKRKASPQKEKSPQRNVVLDEEEEEEEAMPPFNPPPDSQQPEQKKSRTEEEEEEEEEEEFSSSLGGGDEEEQMSPREGVYTLQDLNNMSETELIVEMKNAVGNDFIEKGYTDREKMIKRLSIVWTRELLGQLSRAQMEELFQRYYSLKPQELPSTDAEKYLEGRIVPEECLILVDLTQGGERITVYSKATRKFATIEVDAFKDTIDDVATKVVERLPYYKGKDIYLVLQRADGTRLRLTENNYLFEEYLNESDITNVTILVNLAKGKQEESPKKKKPKKKRMTKKEKKKLRKIAISAAQTAEEALEFAKQRLQGYTKEELLERFGTTEKRKAVNKKVGWKVFKEENIGSREGKGNVPNSWSIPKIITMILQDDASDVEELSTQHPPRKPMDLEEEEEEEKEREVEELPPRQVAPQQQFSFQELMQMDDATLMEMMRNVEGDKFDSNTPRVNWVGRLMTTLKRDMLEKMTMDELEDMMLIYIGDSYSKSQDREDYIQSLVGRPYIDKDVFEARLAEKQQKPFKKRT